MTEISRDKKNPTWAMAWDDGVAKRKRIIVDIFASGECTCVCDSFNEKYMSDEVYETIVFQHYEIIKPITWRPFEDIEGFKKEFIKRDTRIIYKTNCNIYTIIYVDVTSIITSGGSYGVNNIFNHYTWLDGSPIGVEE